MRILTIGDIAREASEKIHVASHAVRTHGPQPTGRIGNARVWDAALLPQILDSIHRSKGHSGRQKQTVAQ